MIDKPHVKKIPYAEVPYAVNHWHVPEVLDIVWNRRPSHPIIAEQGREIVSALEQSLKLTPVMNMIAKQRLNRPSLPDMAFYAGWQLSNPFENRIPDESYLVAMQAANFTFPLGSRKKGQLDEYIDHKLWFVSGDVDAFLNNEMEERELRASGGTVRLVGFTEFGEFYRRYLNELRDGLVVR